jgi:hypothetical protein
MKNWKLDLFMFKNGLNLDQLEISGVVEKHLQQFDKLSEKELTESLKMNLNSYSYDTDVKKLLESMDEEISERPLLYDLKDLYKKVERKNYGMLYREPLNKILDIISKDDDNSRMNSIVNELVLFDWVPEIKNFVVGLTSDPVQKQNLTSNGAKLQKIYTIVESVNGGHVAYVGDRWFLLSENDVKQCTIQEIVEDKNKLNLLYVMEKAINISDFENETITFAVDENLKISLGMDGKILLNGDKADAQTTLEDIFNSPIIPYMKKNLYEAIKTVHNNLDKIVELDVACKTTTLSKPLTEVFAFNYKDKMYLYSIDKRTGSSFFEYESVNQLIQDVQREMGYDLSNFYENKLSKELKHYKKLEDKEKEISMKLNDVNESIDAIKDNQELMNSSAELKAAFDNLLIHKHNLTLSLNKVKDQKAQSRKQI